MKSEELIRQEGYMELLKPLLKERSDKNGRPFSYHVVTLGCQMNAHDSEKLKGILESVGAVWSDAEEEADLVIYNTCCVRENAEQRVFGRLGALKSIKRTHPDMLIALCGCMMQEKHILEKLRQSYPQVDLVFGTFNFYRIAELLYRRMTSESPIYDIWETHEAIVEDLPTKRKASYKASVNIMFGCDNFCSYCIVPYVRGRERSRRPEDILAEVRALAADGVVEVELLGQNVNSYGKGLPDKNYDFTSLLEDVSQIEGIERIRFMSSHPKDLSPRLIEAFGRLPKLCPHFHLPLQSGSDRILKAMNRHYTAEHYFELCDELYKVCPDMAITTDLIIGFPGETEEDVDATIEAVKRVRFSGAFTFIYSRRVGTPAAEMENQVDPAEAQKGFDRLLAVLNEVQTEDNKAFLGRTVTVVGEEKSKNDATMMTGRTGSNRLVHYHTADFTPGRQARVKVTETTGFYLIGDEIDG